MIYFIALPELRPPIITFGLGSGRTRLSHMANSAGPWRAELLGTAPGDRDTLEDLKHRFQPCRRPDGWYVDQPPLSNFLSTLQAPAVPEPRREPLIPVTAPADLTFTDLRAWRDRFHLSQPQAALLLGIPVASYRQYEQGRIRLPGLMARATQAIALLYPVPEGGTQ